MKECSSGATPEIGTSATVRGTGSLTKWHYQRRITASFYLSNRKNQRMSVQPLPFSACFFQYVPNTASRIGPTIKEYGFPEV